jgi:hypothetical protein
MKRFKNAKKNVKTPYLNEGRLPEYLVGLAGELELLDNLRWLVHLENDTRRHNTEAVLPLSQVLHGQHPRSLVNRQHVKRIMVPLAKEVKGTARTEALVNE